MPPDDHVAAPAGRAAAPARPHNRFPCFDGVRALAALMVVVYHAVFFNTAFVTRGGAFLGTLNAGVWVFFVTSGFLLYLPFAASHLAGAPPVDERRYAIRRVARIFPAYWVVLAFFTFVFAKVNIIGVHGFIVHSTLTFTYQHIKNPFAVGLPPAWSLVVELSFYVFLPFYAAVIGAVARRARPLTVELVGLAGLFAVGVIAIVALANGLDAPWVTVLPQHLGAFALGMFLAVLSGQRWDDRTSARLQRIGTPAWIWWSGALAALLVIAYVLRLDPLASMNAGQAIGLNFCQMLVGLCIVVPVVLGPQDRGVIRRVLRSRVAVYLGLISYGLYLWHWYILQMLADRLGWPLFHGNWIAILALGLPIVIVAASASWFGVERPILRLVHRVGPARRNPDEANVRDKPALHDA